jgi:hypothetical protein
MVELGIPFLDLWEAYFLSGGHELDKRLMEGTSL